MSKTITKAAAVQTPPPAAPDFTAEREQRTHTAEPAEAGPSRKRSPYFEDINDEYKPAKGRGRLVAGMNELFQHTLALAALADVVRASMLRTDYADNVDCSDINDPNEVSFCPGNRDGLMLAQMLLSSRALNLAEHLCEQVSTED
jgi:hypothetical protein